MRELTPIRDPDDPRVEGYRNLRERDLRGREGLFVAEGTVILRALLDAPAFEPVSVLVLKNRVNGVQDLLDRVPPAIPVFVAEGAVMDRVAGFPMHRGVLALAKRTKEPSLDALLSGPPRRLLVGIEIANHDNVGSLLRAGAAFGVGAVLFDERSADPLYRKAIRTSAGAALRLPHRRGDPAGVLLDRIEGAGLAPLALSPGGERDIRDIDPDQALALIMGAEGPGLSTDVLKRCRAAHIAMAEGHDSLNVATAAAIALHTLHGR